MTVYFQNLTGTDLNHCSHLAKQPNVRGVLFDPAELFEGTPLGPWYQDQQLQMSNSPDGTIPGFTSQNHANAFRLALLYKHGGRYLDLDIITLANFDSLPRNSIGLEGGGCRLNNAAMFFDKEHPFILEYMNEFVAHFNNTLWGNQGPLRAEQTCEKLHCDATNSSRSPKCDNMTIVAASTFAPYRWKELCGTDQPKVSMSLTDVDWEQLLVEWSTPAQKRRVWQGQRSVYSIHLYNHVCKLDNLTTVSAPDGVTFFDRLMVSQCGTGWKEL